MTLPLPIRPLRTIFALIFVVLPLFIVLGLNKIGDGAAAAAPSPQANPFGQTYVPEAFIPLTYDYFTASKMLYDAPRQRIYLASMGHLISINLINRIATRITVIPGAAYVGDLALQEDGQVLYVVSTQSGSSRLYLLNPNNWAMIHNYALPDTSGIELVNGRIFLPYAYQNKMQVLDAATGAVQQTLTFTEAIGAPTASPDGNTLFTHGFGTLQKYDISTAPITLTLSVNAGTNINQVAISFDGSYLLVSRYPDDQLTRYRTDDLGFMDVIPALTGHDIRDIATGEGVFYGLYAEYGTRPVLRTFDALTGEEVRYYTRQQEGQQYFNQMEVLDDGRVAIHSSGSSAGNEVIVFSPADYGLALPVLYKEYCSGPYIDDFSDPDSGWPVGTSGSITYRYITGEYSLLHAQADQWGGATLGHTLESIHHAQIDTRILGYQDGIVGVIYGLNSDWSDFYTFEIWPNEQIWINYHYSSAQGWQLVQYSQDSSIRSQGPNQLLTHRDPGSSSLTFFVNTSYVYSAPYIPGRFGVSAAAFEANVDFRYDNYIYVGVGCENMLNPPTEATASPVTLLPRPAIADLLDTLP
jgi:hypothetical protein